MTRIYPALLSVCSLCFLSGVLLSAADGPASEAHSMDERQIPVTNRSDIKLRHSRDNDAEVKQRELYYSQYQEGTWGDWQRHGITFGRNDRITWSPPEGHWRVYIRTEDISGLATAVPDADATADAEFIIDRTPPKAALTFPSSGAHLRGGDDYKITYDLSDPYIHSKPVTLRYQRSSDAEWSNIVAHTSNDGSYAWTTPKDMTATGKLQLLAWDKAGNRASTEIDGLIIDAINPSRNILGPKISASKDVNLSISARNAGPSSLDSVQLWYSDDNGQNWKKGPQRSEEPWDTLAWTAPGDGSYTLNLVAADLAGNQTANPSSAADGMATILIDTTAPEITIASAIGIRQAGADSDDSLRRIYKPGDRVSVAFSVTEANLGNDAATVHLQIEDGAPWKAVGEGLDSSKPFTFAIPNANTDTARIRVQVLDLAGNLGQATASETFSIRNEVDHGDVQIEFD